MNGLRSHHDEIQLLLRNHDIHILATNETKLDPSYSTQLTRINGFEHERKDRTSNGGGVAIYIKDSISYKLRKDIPHNELEFICVEILPPKAKSYFVVAWYRPPSNLVESFSKLELILSFLDKEEKELILLGDTNCDFTVKEGVVMDSNAKHLTNIYELFTFKQLITEPIRVTANSSSVIDHIVTTSPRNIVTAGVIPISLSDHFMVFCVRKFEGGVIKDHKTIKARRMKNFNEQMFLNDVASINWIRALGQTDDINILVRNWSSLFSSVIEKHAPVQTMRVSDKYCPWVNADLRALIKSRDKLKLAASKNKSTLLMSSYRNLRNKVNSLNTKLKWQYFATRVSKFKGNMKESWKTINLLFNKRSKSTNIDLLRDQNKTISNKGEISQSMNSFFCSIGKDLASNIEDGHDPLIFCDYFLNSDAAKFAFKSIHAEQIKEAIGKLKTSKSFSDDGISSYFLKLAMPFIEDSLVYIFNTSLETSQFPDPWKIARVSPIFKDGDKTEKSNYRPISVLPVVSRLFEKLVFSQLYQYLNDNCFINSNQSGFRELHSTVTCLLKNTDDWYNGLDTGNLAGMVFVDLKKAFDTVDHQILCRKLESYGVLHKELAWFGSYLSNRVQYCRVNGVDSQIENIDVGVPQGSCLGPLIFLVYINDLPRAVKNSTISMYADDTSLCFKSKDLSRLNEALNEDLSRLDAWLNNNKLSLNVAKTQSMLVSTKAKRKTLDKSSQHLQVKINGTELEVVSKIKYLGVLLDNSLDWKDQVQAVSLKVSRGLGILKHAKNFLPFSALTSLYTSIVEPHFRYCCSVWGCAGTTEINRLQKLQNRAARIVTNSSFDTPSNKLIEKLGWNTINELIDIESKTIVFKSLNELAPPYLRSLFRKNSQSTSYRLRKGGSPLADFNDDRHKNRLKSSR